MIPNAVMEYPEQRENSLSLTTEQIILAWKSPEYRRQLNPEQLAILPEHPSQHIQPRIMQPTQDLDTALDCDTFACTGYYICESAWQCISDNCTVNCDIYGPTLENYSCVWQDGCTWNSGSC